MKLEDRKLGNLNAREIAALILELPDSGNPEINLMIVCKLHSRLVTEIVSRSIMDSLIHRIQHMDNDDMEEIVDVVDKTASTVIYHSYGIGPLEEDKS